MGLNILIEVVIMDHRQFYRKKYARNYTKDNTYVVFSEWYGNELVKKLKEIGGTCRSLWVEKDPDVDNDYLFSENTHMWYTRYSSKTLLILAQMSSDTSLNP